MSAFTMSSTGLFFQLQQLHNSDVMEIIRWKRVDVQKQERSPVEWMEWQAHVGSQCLQMPQTHLRKRLQEELDGENPPGRHMGYRLQAIGRALAKEYGVRNYQMRNRMIQLGYTAAKGVLQFCRRRLYRAVRVFGRHVPWKPDIRHQPKGNAGGVCSQPGFPGTAGHGALRLCRPGHICVNDLRMWCCTTASCA